MGPHSRFRQHLQIPIQVLMDETGDIHEDVQRQLQGRLLALRLHVECKMSYANLGEKHLLQISPVERFRQAH